MRGGAGVAGAGSLADGHCMTRHNSTKMMPPSIAKKKKEKNKQVSGGFSFFL